MKKGILVAGLFILSGTAFAQKASLKVSAKAAAQAQVDAQKNSLYNPLMGKDVTTVLNALNVKDTIGKTSYAKASQMLTVLVPNGDQLTFKNDKLNGVFYKK